MHANSKENGIREQGAGHLTEHCLNASQVKFGYESKPWVNLEAR